MKANTMNYQHARRRPLPVSTWVPYVAAAALIVAVTVVVVFGVTL